MAEEKADSYQRDLCKTEEELKNTKIMVRLQLLLQ